MDLTHALEIVRLTDVGKRREHNEDTVASDTEIGLVILADGMGGYQAGEVASEIAVLTIVAELKEAMLEAEAGSVDGVTGMQMESRLLTAAVAKANEAIYSISQSHEQCTGMGTTLMTGLFTNNKLLVGHIGDSRMYRFRDSGLVQITEDHSLIQEQVRLGLITPEQAKFAPNQNLVTRALGVGPAVELELQEYDVEVGDIYLLCSDGLSDQVDDAEMAETLCLLHDNLELAATRMVQAANEHGGKDNVSVILVKVLQPFGAERDWYGHFLNWLR